MEYHVIACILAGGEGKRLWPLTARRAKPAVRFGGSHRLIDFSLSNCVNSNIRTILVLSQYQALSLERHLLDGWSFPCQAMDVSLLSLPPQPQRSPMGYRGTADAIFQNLSTLERFSPSAVLILGGDHIYSMDYSHLIECHRDAQADVTVATFPVPRHQSRHFGVLTVDPLWRVTSFQEKPQELSGVDAEAPCVLASMGIYVFSFDVLRHVLHGDSRLASTHDFGHDILPAMFGSYRVAAYPFVEGAGEELAYWRDVGTIDAYWEAHMDLLGPHPRFRLYQSGWPLYPVYTAGRPTTLLPSREVCATGTGEGNSLIAQGCLIKGGRVERSILSPGVHIEAGAEVQESILFDGVHVGRGARVRRAILDCGTAVPPWACIGYDHGTNAERLTVSPKGITVVGGMRGAKSCESHGYG